MSGLFNMSASDTLEDNVLNPPIKKKRRLKRNDNAFQGSLPDDVAQADVQYNQSGVDSSRIRGWGWTRGWGSRLMLSILDLELHMPVL